MINKESLRILVAPLDWGLGHATRCIPIIQYLMHKGCTVFIGAEGSQKSLLEKEFPTVQILELKGYRVNYSKRKRLFVLKIIQQIPTIIHTVITEHNWLKKAAKRYSFDAIISDNRYGLYHYKIPSIFITHQLRIKAPTGLLENILQFLNYRLINRFSQCWVPDFQGQETIAGKLSNVRQLPAVTTNYIGAISRFAGGQQRTDKYDFIAIISGPEPQRKIFEEKILNDLSDYPGKALVVRGLPSEQTSKTCINQVEIVNHLSAKELEAAVLASRLVIARSGYTTIMDILKLRKQAVFVPTPGQTEQEYLAAHLNTQHWAMKVLQRDFQLSEVLAKADAFPYKLPVLNMELYKKYIDEFLLTLQKR